MTMKTIQRLIKIGSSQGVTLPAKDLQHLGLKPGDPLQLTYGPAPKQEEEAHSVEVVELTQKLIKRHQKALENLSQR